MTELVGILLAAGSARRFGAAKLLHPLPGWSGHRCRCCKRADGGGAEYDSRGTAW